MRGGQGLLCVWSETELKMQPIEVPDELKSKCGSNLHWGLYKVDVKVRSGAILYNLSVRDKAVFEPTVGEPLERYNFRSLDVVSIRPATLLSRIKTIFYGW